MQASDGYKSCSQDKSWKSGTGNVRESNLNKGKKWGTAMKAKKPKAMKAGKSY